MTIGMIPRYFAIEARCIKINNGKHEFKIISTSNKWPSSIHPKQTNKYPDINGKCRGIVRIQNKTMPAAFIPESVLLVRLCSATNTSSSPLKSTKLMRQQHLFYSPNTQLCLLALSNRQPPTENSSMAMEALLNAAASSPSRPPLSKTL